MNDKEKSPTQIVITQDKLVDLLMHSATREDIAKLDSKIDNKFDAVIAEFKRSNEALEARIDRQFSEMRAHNDRQFQKIDHRYNWIIATAFAIGIGLAGLIIKMH